MKKTMMLMMVAVVGIAAADVDVDALKAALEKVADPETQCRIGNCYFEGRSLPRTRPRPCAGTARLPIRGMRTRSAGWGNGILITML